jgi:hypothetical protein
MKTRTLTLWILALTLGGNGLFMLLLPETWYHTLPTVASTGPFNPHFVRDIGCAYIVCAGAIAWLALNRAGGRAAAFTAGIFLLMHALVHLWDAAAGRASLEHLAQDFVGVLLVPALVLWIARPRRARQGVAHV